MSKAFEKMKAGLEEALAYAQGTADKSKYRVHVPAQIDVKEIRANMGMSQEEFAQRFNLTTARVRDWEQGRSKPDSAARAYLIVIMKDRTAVERALSDNSVGGVSPADPVQKVVKRSGVKMTIGGVLTAKADKFLGKKAYTFRSEPNPHAFEMAPKRGGAVSKRAARKQA